MFERQKFSLGLRSADFSLALAIEVTGKLSADTVILGNGFGTDQRCWDRVLPWLEARKRVVRFNWAVDPAHFDTVRYGELDGFVEDLLAVIHVTSSAPCTLVGHSMSAMIGMLAAKETPEAFSRIVMVAPAPCFVSREDFIGGLSEESIEALLEHMGDDYLAWVTAFAPVAVGDPMQTEAIDDFQRSLQAMRPDIALSMAKVIFTMDLRDQLDGFATPTTIIQPTGDPVVPVQVGRYLADRWPQARLEIVEASGHLPHLNEPTKVIEVLERALG